MLNPQQKKTSSGKKKTTTQPCLAIPSHVCPITKTQTTTTCVPPSPFGPASASKQTNKQIWSSSSFSFCVPLFFVVRLERELIFFYVSDPQKPTHCLPDPFLFYQQNLKNAACVCVCVCVCVCACACVCAASATVRSRCGAARRGARALGPPPPAAAAVFAGAAALVVVVVFPLFDFFFSAVFFCCRGEIKNCQLPKLPSPLVLFLSRPFPSS